MIGKLISQMVEAKLNEHYNGLMESLCHRVKQDVYIETWQMVFRKLVEDKTFLASVVREINALQLGEKK